MVSDFKENGFYAQSSLFTKEALQKYSLEFDRIVAQLQESGEAINARWGSELTKDIEQSESQVIHTHNVQSYSAQMMAMIQNEQFLDAVEELIGPDIILHHTKLFLKPPFSSRAVLSLSADIKLSVHLLAAKRHMLIRIKDRSFGVPIFYAGFWLAP